jgi:hypothetical protein
MLNTNIHPLVVGSVGMVGVSTSEAVISDSTLSIILQIIIALSTLLKLYTDYQRNKNEKNQNNG